MSSQEEEIQVQVERQGCIRQGQREGEGVKGLDERRGFRVWIAVGQQT